MKILQFSKMQVIWDFMADLMLKIFTKEKVWRWDRKFLIIWVVQSLSQIFSEFHKLKKNKEKIKLTVQKLLQKSTIQLAEKLEKLLRKLAVQCLKIYQLPKKVLLKLKRSRCRGLRKKQKKEL